MCSRASGLKVVGAQVLVAMAVDLPGVFLCYQDSWASGPRGPVASLTISCALWPTGHRDATRP